jgi:3-oxoacyl-[acyl-carrier-protein] synthase-1
MTRPPPTPAQDTSAPPVIHRQLRALVETMGMGSALGPHVQACAAFRAGLDRMRGARDFHYFAGEENEKLELRVAALPVATFGFSGVGRLVAIACETFQDLRERLAPAAITRETPLFLALPDPLDLGIPVSPELERNEERRMESLCRRVLSLTFENLGWPWPGGAWKAIPGGRTAFARALQAAGAYLAGRPGGSCVVAALDSLLDPQLLEPLLQQRRLKTEDNPVGIIPGEAGVALLLRAADRLPAADLRSRALIRGVSLTAPPDEDMPPDGRALAACVRALLPSQELEAEPFWVSDHTGEEERALEWGNLQVLLRGEPPHWGTFDAWFPVMGFGDTGAVSGGVGLCLAARALERGYAPARSILVLSAAEDGGRSAILLTSSM